MTSLIFTVRNESGTIGDLINSIYEQSVMPDEIVVVDGGSTDGTIEILKAVAEHDSRWRVYVRPDCSLSYSPSPVARGRNVAIDLARGDIILVTDGGCVLHRDWIKTISAFPEMWDVRSGKYWWESKDSLEQAIVDLMFSFVQKDPSSRSVAFKKSIWKAVGGYPEVSLTAEDTLFNQSLRRYGANFSECDAFVYYKPETNLVKLWTKYFRFGKGDAICGLRSGDYLRISLKYIIGLALLSLSSLLIWLAL